MTTESQVDLNLLEELSQKADELYVTHKSKQKRIQVSNLKVSLFFSLSLSLRLHHLTFYCIPLSDPVELIYFNLFARRMSGQLI